MKYSQQQFEHLVSLFNSRDLPKVDWTHETHVLVAFWYVSRYDQVEALNRVRQAIKDYNTAVGTINSDTSGYHETLTVFWLKIVRYFLTLKTFPSVIDAVNSFIAAGNSDKTFPLQFYSSEILFSKEARQQWVEPDKISLTNIDAVFTSPIEALRNLKT